MYIDIAAESHEAEAEINLRTTSHEDRTSISLIEDYLQAYPHGPADAETLYDELLEILGVSR